MKMLMISITNYEVDMATLNDLERASTFDELSSLRSQLVGKFPNIDINNIYNKRRKYLLSHQKCTNDVTQIHLPPYTPQQYFTIPVVGTSAYPNTVEFVQEKGFLL